MKLLFVVILLFALISALNAKHGKSGMVDNDFAEFEDFDEDEVSKPETGKSDDTKQAEPKVIMSPEAAQNEQETKEEEDGTIEDDDENSHFLDDEMFVGYDIGKGAKNSKEKDDLKFADVAVPLHTNWDSFYMEMLMLAGLCVYFLNFLTGRSANNKMAQAWLSSHKEILEKNFSVVGDDGTGTEVQRGILMKESENIYSLWCSGRSYCEGMLVTLKLLKRQDLVSTISRCFKKACDQVIIKIKMERADMDNFVFCIGQKKALQKYHKEMTDLSTYCPDKRAGEKFGLPSHFQVMSEIGEATASILDRQMCEAVTRFASMIEYIHLSDQYSGPKQQDQDQQPTSKLPQTEKVLIFSFTGRSTAKDMETMLPLLKMVLHVLDKVKRFNLSREGALKATKNRQRAEAEAQKAAHAQRQERAQERREEKKRETKEKIMNEEDPERQRKWEERERRREDKKKQPKVKMMKIKAM